jgi:hypothetical protein
VRIPASPPDVLTDQEDVVGAFAGQLRLEPAARNRRRKHVRSELPQLLLSGLPAAAAYLDLTPEQLRVWLEYGGPLATIARAQEREVDTVIDIFVEHATFDCELLAAAGWLPIAQQIVLLEELSRRLETTRWDADSSRQAA